MNEINMNDIMKLYKRLGIEINDTITTQEIVDKHFIELENLVKDFNSIKLHNIEELKLID